MRPCNVCFSSVQLHACSSPNKAMLLSLFVCARLLVKTSLRRFQGRLLACCCSLSHTYRHTQPSKHIRIHGRWWLMAAHACTYESHAHGGIVPYVCTALSCISLVALFAVSTCCTSSGFQGQLGNRGRRGTVGIREDQKLDYAKCRWCC